MRLFIFGAIFGYYLSLCISALKNNEAFLEAVSEMRPGSSSTTVALWAMVVVAITPFWDLYKLCAGRNER